MAAAEISKPGNAGGSSAAPAPDAPVVNNAAPAGTTPATSPTPTGTGTAAAEAPPAAAQPDKAKTQVRTGTGTGTAPQSGPSAAPDEKPPTKKEEVRDIPDSAVVSEIDGQPVTLREHRLHTRQYRRLQAELTKRSTELKQIREVKDAYEWMVAFANQNPQIAQQFEDWVKNIQASGMVPTSVSSMRMPPPPPNGAQAPKTFQIPIESQRPSSMPDESALAKLLEEYGVIPEGAHRNPSLRYERQMETAFAAFEKQTGAPLSSHDKALIADLASDRLQVSEDLGESLSVKEAVSDALREFLAMNYTSSRKPSQRSAAPAEPAPALANGEPPPTPTLGGRGAGAPPPATPESTKASSSPSSVNPNDPFARASVQARAGIKAWLDARKGARRPSSAAGSR